ncbi:GntR family transcriptional regulator [Streptacidiphilus sp. 4-A2]|nr:GntR family transcriptional regulator [Streptacidiphilus sp. 4-A2]
MAAEWQSGQPLPVESELEGQYGVARNTVRLAVDVLVNEGLLIRVQGKGTYLKDHPVLDHFAYRSDPGASPRRRSRLLLSLMRKKLIRPVGNYPRTFRC